jgi:PKD repeat protein
VNASPFFICLLIFIVLRSSAQINADFVFAPSCDSSVQFYPVASTIYQAEWNFGDGNTSSALNPVHLYAADGIYLVTLTISDSTASVSNTEVVLVPPSPEAVILGDLQVCRLDTISYSTQLEPMETPQWSVYGGSVIQNTTSSISVVWQGAQGSVTLQVVNSFGCSKTTTEDVTIHPNPLPTLQLGLVSDSSNFVSTLNYCTGDVVNLEVFSSGQPAWSGSVF